MNFRANMKPENLGIAIAPMVDVVFLLLIFFLLTWNFARYETELEVTVPEASEGKEVRRAAGDVILNVKSDGTVVMNRRTMDMDELKNTLTEIAKLYPDQAIVLRGDQSVDFKHIVQVLDICTAANITNVAFAVAKPE